MIALGTTIKKAGSKKQLHAIDVELVIKVAKDMLTLGVEHIIVISCLGASPKGVSHYLRCKGEMEMRLQQLTFKTITFLQPGPLAGPRDDPRMDERVLQCVMQVISPCMLGSLQNYKPIDATDVAKVIIHLATEQLDLKKNR
ncbi:hypothetical protein [Psychromonas sp. MME1]|uniref:hypothetical protein n=1 Tax=Psychromonas sp. MME1 TaxID=3231032 RepID=UPI0034E2D1E2